jgi:hypothetical protein
MIKAYAEGYNRMINTISSSNSNKKHIRNSSRRPTRDLLRFILKLSSEKENQSSVKFHFLEDENNCLLE